MAAKLFTHRLTNTPNANPRTVWQIRVPANERVLLHKITFMPKGATPAAASLTWHFGLNDAAGTMDTDDSAAILKEVPAFGGSILSTVHINCSVEPAFTPYYTIGLSQMATWVWIPPTKSGYLILDQSTRWALKWIGAVPGFAIDYQFHLEE